MDTFNYIFTVDNQTKTTSGPYVYGNGYGSIKGISTTGTNGSYTTSCTVQNCGCGGWHYYYWYPDGYHWYPKPQETKYLYQILCPKPGCTGKFWAEVDEIKACPKCKSKIKITDKESDYEVAVTK